MVTAAQLQILQSPITALISTISTSVNVKLDDTNYLNWHFQICLLLESNGIYGFVDGTHPCPSSVTVDECGTHNSPSSSSIDCDDILIWKLHDRALMQLITATLSPIAMSCAIGSVSSRDLWNRLIEQFSIVSKTSIFQMKTNLQNIKKGADTISQYLLKIKEARDYLTAAGVHFADEDIIILALNGLPLEYNTFRCVIRGRESVIALKEFRSQLLAEEKIVDTIVPETHTYLTAMHTSKSAMSHPSFGQQHNRVHAYNSYDNGGYKPFNRNRGKSRYVQGFRHMNSRPQFPVKTSNLQHMTSAVSNMIVCQLCN